MRASSTAGCGVRALIVPFVVPPYPLRQGYRDYPDAVLLHSAIRRSELQWRLRYADAPGLDLIAAQEQALREREASRPPGRVPFRGRPVPGSCNWTFLGPRNVGGRVTGIAVHPTNADRVWVGTADGGVWRSDDAGKSWTPLFDDQDSLSIGALAVAPSDGDRIYVGSGETNSNYDELPGSGVYRSDDGGDTWTRIATATQLAPRISAIWVHPTNPDILLVGSPGGGGGNPGMWRSTDGGATWQAARVLSEVVWEIEGRDPPNGDTVYCAVSSTAGVIRKSTDAGRTWTTPFPGLTPLATGGASISIDRVALGVAGGSSNRVYARACVHWGTGMTAESHGRCYRSDDGGSTWNGGVDDGAGYMGGYANALTVRPDNADVVVTGSLNTARSSDGGISFALTGVGTGHNWRQEHYSGPVDLHTDVHALAYGPRANPDRLYFGGDGGVYVNHFAARGVDGQAWVKRNHGLNATQLGYLGVSPTASSMLGGGTQDNGTPRTLGGLTWRSVYGGDGGIFEVNPSNTAECFFQYVSGDLRRSLDGGRTQVQFTAGLNLDTEDVGWLKIPFAFHPTAASTKYAATSRVYQSVGDGDWTPISNVLTEAAGDTDWHP